MFVSAAVGGGERPSADKVLYGTVWTANKRRPSAAAVAVWRDRVLAVGSVEDIGRFVNPETRIIDTHGFIMPGWIDAHVHLIDGGLNLTSVQLRNASSREDFVQRLADYARDGSPGEWITGGDWDHSRWGGALPDRRWIDAVTSRTPVWVQRLDGHMALANSEALRLASISDDVSDVKGGEIVRDAGGRMTGILKDNAMRLVQRVVPRPTLQQRLEATSAAMKYLARQGVTAVHHMGTWDDVEILRVAHRQGRLKVRVYASTPLDEWRHLADEVRRRGWGDDWLRIGGLKGFVDGSLGSRTAAFLQPYSDDGENYGLMVHTPEDLETWIAGADRAGLQVMVHAIGDRAVREQLDIFARVARENGPRDRRFRIEHAQHIAPEDIPRFGRLKIIASMQPYHVIDDGRWAQPVIGSVRSATTYAFRSLLDNGTRLAFGSDWFVAPPQPLMGIYAAATRRTLDGAYPDGWMPQQKVTVGEALRAYTIDAAYAGFAESRLGSLEPDKLADIVVVDCDLTRINAKQLPEVDVLLTVVGGRITYDKQRSAPAQQPPATE